MRFCDGRPLRQRALIPVPAPLWAALSGLLLALSVMTTAAEAQSRNQPRSQPGDFDYYLLALSWSPSFCALEGDRRGAAECQSGADRDFILHGLWPQYEEGWPDDCQSSQRNPSRRETAAMADIMGSGGLAWHEWQKHGRCSGLSSKDYFALARRAYNRIDIPDVLENLDRDIRLPAHVVEEAFTESNPGLGRDGVTVTCEAGRIREVRICLTRDLQFRDCAPDTRQDCRLPQALMEAPR